MKFLALILLFAAPAAGALADTVVIPLPELAGGYEATEFTEPNLGYPQMRAVDITIPPEITGIDQLELVVSGEWNIGEITCDDGGGPQTFPFEAWFSLYLLSDSFPEDFFSAEILAPDGSFTDLSSVVTSCCPPGVLDPAALLGTEIHAEFAVSWGLIGICWPTIDSYGTVTDVHLEITGTVAVESETWSAVKSLYR